MKPFSVVFLSILLLGGTGLLRGQTAAGGQPTTVTQQLPSPTPYAITTQDGNSRVWERTEYEKAADGSVVTTKHDYTEIQSGLNYKDPATGLWKESREEIDIQPGSDGAFAIQGQHQAYFPGDIFQGMIKEVTPDGLQLQSRPVGLFYADDTNSVLIAILTNSVGELVSSNQIVYSNAFEGADASIRYTYRKAGFEQDVIVQGQLPDPAALGLGPAQTRLGVLTVFFNTNDPVATPGPVDAADGIIDWTLTFGSMTMGPGRAFSIGDTEPTTPPVGATPAQWLNWLTNSVQQAGETPTFKHWFQMSGRNYLMEEVPYQRVAAQLSQLPATARQDVVSTNLYAANTFLEAIPARLLSPSVQLSKSKMTRLARRDQLHGLVLDYVTVSSGGNYTFQGDTTYYVSGTVSLSGTVTVEGGAVLKYASGAQLTLVYPPVWQASAYRPVILTAKDDNTVGETISGSTGSPSGFYASSALVFEYPPTISNFRISYAQTAITLNESGNPDFSNGQVVNCGYGFTFGSGSSGNLTNRNMLFANMGYVCYNGIPAWPSWVYVQNTTFSSSGYDLATTTGSGGLNVINCIFANASTTFYGSVYLNGNNNGFYNSPPFAASTFTNTFNPFQTVGAGAYYLTNGCTFTNKGTASIDPALLASLKQKTTMPPMVYSNVTISTNITLAPYARRDTNSSPNLGYHYDPIDYIADLCAITNATLTLTNGVAVATYNEAGIKLQDNSAIVSIGSPLYPNWFARYSSVQEKSVSLGGTNNNSGIDVYPSYTSSKPNGTYQFTKFACPANGGFHLDDYSNASYGGLNVQECEFWGGTNVLGGTNGTTLLLDNNLFARSCIGAVGSGSLSFSNNLVWGTASAQLNPSSGTVWYAYNNDFDSTTIASSTLTNGYNAYLFCTGYLSPTNSTDIFTNSTLAYKSSWLGAFYQPTNSLLIDKGSTNANLLGLYHYTTQTNQVPETNSTVDIGYHYVATNTNGVPLDSNGDGIPDYLEDANGDGLVDNGETNWALAILVQPTNQTAYVGDNVTFSVTAMGLAPISYQWRFNGTNILGATNAALVLNVVQTNNAGNYSVTVSNALGSINSSSALLTVYVPSYPVLFSPQTNYVFRGDTTYYIVGNVILYGTNNILEGGAVLKFATNGSAGITVSNGVTLNCLTAPYRPAIFTSKDDNSMGSTINNSTGTPTNYYGGYGLSFGSTILPSLHNLRFVCLNTGIIDNNLTNSIQDVQFVNCYYSIGYAGSNSDIVLQNVLVQGGSNAIYNLAGGEGSVSCVNGTFHNAFIPTNAAYLALTNCLAAGCGFPSFVGTSNVFLTNDSGIFQTVGAGANYLATNSIYRNAGTTNVGSSMLADIQAKTTYPPLIYSNVTVSVNTSLSPQAQRDTDTPDLGYHYDPVDYFVDAFRITNAVLTVLNGTVIAYNNDYWNPPGIWLQDGSSITSIGTATAPNWIVHYTTVQEQPVTTGTYTFSQEIAINPYHLSAAAPTGTYFFTKFSSPGGGGTFLYHLQNAWNYANLLVQNCEFWSGSTYFGGYSNTMATLKNNLFARCTFSATTALGSSLLLTNNLFWGALTVQIKPGGSNQWYAINNDFDSCSSITSGSGISNANNNAFFNCVGQVNPTNSTDIFQTNALAFQAGPLGSFYQPTNSPLINMGSTTADQVGLYHYTTQTNQVPETNSTVDIGYHYVATDTNGVPLDSNGDGIPGYLEDANGNGVVDSGEIGWNITGDLGLQVLITQPKNGGTIP